MNVERRTREKKSFLTLLQTRFYIPIYFSSITLNCLKHRSPSTFYFLYMWNGRELWYFLHQMKPSNKLCWHQTFLSKKVFKMPSLWYFIDILSIGFSRLFWHNLTFKEGKVLSKSHVPFFVFWLLLLFWWGTGKI